MNKAPDGYNDTPKDSLSQFIKGKSGLPEEIFSTVYQIMTNWQEDTDTRIKAATFLAERGWGKNDTLQVDMNIKNDSNWQARKIEVIEAIKQMKYDEQNTPILKVIDA